MNARKILVAAMLSLSLVGVSLTTANAAGPPNVFSAGPINLWDYELCYASQVEYEYVVEIYSLDGDLLSEVVYPDSQQANRIADFNNWYFHDRYAMVVAVPLPQEWYSNGVYDLRSEAQADATTIEDILGLDTRIKRIPHPLTRR